MTMPPPSEGKKPLRKISPEVHLKIMPGGSEKMAAPATSPPPSGDEGNVADDAAAVRAKCSKALFAIRAEIQQLQPLLNDISKGEPAITHVGYIKKTMKDIGEQMPDVEDPGCVEGMRRIHNYWEQMQSYTLLTKPDEATKAEGGLKPEDQAHQIARLNAIIAAIVWEIGYYTIPDTLQGWLGKQRPGYFVPFNDIFEDELPQAQDRKKMLHYLKFAPEVMPTGIVDEENDLIYRYEPDPRKRWPSYLLLLFAFLLAGGIVVSSAFWPIKGWFFTSKDAVTLVVGWAAVLVGLIVHVMVGSAKRMKAKGGTPPVMAVGEFLLWANAKAGPIVFKILLTLIGFYGFMFITGVDKATPWGFFLVGYSLDSFVELFGSTVEQKAAKQVETVKNQLQPTAG